jgi:siroheme synthase (precorrin-2 oxidase/ferrochelatase)
MARNYTFKFRINAEEREQIDFLAQYYRRSRGDMLRNLVIAAIQERKINAIHQKSCSEKGVRIAK